MLNNFLVVIDSAQNIVGLLNTLRIIRNDLAIRHFILHLRGTSKATTGTWTCTARTRAVAGSGTARNLLIGMSVQAAWVPGVKFLERHGFDPWRSWVGMKQKAGGLRELPFSTIGYGPPRLKTTSPSQTFTMPLIVPRCLSPQRTFPSC